MINSPIGVRKTNYLSRAAGNKNQQHYRRDCSLMVWVAYPRKGLKDLQFLKARIVKISEGDAVAIMPYETIPNYFYIVFGEYQHLVGCAVTLRNKKCIELKFLKEQPSPVINYLSRIEVPISTMKKMDYDFKTMKQLVEPLVDTEAAVQMITPTPAETRFM